MTETTDRRAARGSGSIRNLEEQRPYQVRYADDDGNRKTKTFTSREKAVEWLGDREGKISKRSIAQKWEARYRGLDGKTHSKTFANKNDASRWLRNQLADVDRGEWTAPSAGKETVESAYQVFIHGVAAGDASPKTVAGYESLWRSQVGYSEAGPVWADHQLRQVTTRGLRAWIDNMAAADLSSARQRAALQLLGAIFRRAVSDGLIPRSPLDGLPKGARPTVRRRRQRFLDHFKVKALADAAEAQQEGMGTFVTFLAYSGLRWGEATALRAGDITRNGNGRAKVSVSRAYSEVNGELHLGGTKTHETRTIILVPWVSRMLFDHTDGSADDALVFTAPMGGPLRTSNFRKAVWELARDASGVPDDLMVHDLRDTAASLAIASGATILAVQRMLGHASAAMTLDIYGGLFEQDLEDLADRVDASTPVEVKGAWA